MTISPCPIQYCPICWRQGRVTRLFYNELFNLMLCPIHDDDGARRPLTVGEVME